MGAAAAGSVTQQHQGRQQQGDEAAELLEQQAIHARMVILRIGMAEGEQAQLALLAEPQHGGRVHQRLLTKQQVALVVIQTTEIDRLTGQRLGAELVEAHRVENEALIAALGAHRTGVQPQRAGRNAQAIAEGGMQPLPQLPQGGAGKQFGIDVGVDPEDALVAAGGFHQRAQLLLLGLDAFALSLLVQLHQRDRPLDRVRDLQLIEQRLVAQEEIGMLSQVGHHLLLLQLNLQQRRLAHSSISPSNTCSAGPVMKTGFPGPFQAICRVPPGRCTLTRSRSLPWAMPTTAAAQAPVPQAMVSPAPRSNTRRRISLAETSCMKPTLTRSGKRSKLSSSAPSVPPGAVLTSSTSSTQCGLPMETTPHITVCSATRSR